MQLQLLCNHLACTVKLFRVLKTMRFSQSADCINVKNSIPNEMYGEYMKNCKQLFYFIFMTRAKNIFKKVNNDLNDFFFPS